MRFIPMLLLLAVITVPVKGCDGKHVPGPKPTPPTPDDTPPELEKDPLPPL